MTFITFDRKKLQYWLARLSASDPGLTRLRRAGRVVLSVMCGVSAMALVVALGAHVQFTSVILAGILGLMGNVTVHDDTEQKQKMTTLILPVSSAISVTMAAVLSEVGYHLGDIFLLIIVFLLFYLQRFGRRFFSFGMVAFISFYFSTMLGVQVPFLPWYYVAILLGATMAYLFHFIILPEDSDRILKHSLASYHTLINLTFDLMIDMIRDPIKNAKRVKSLNRNVTRINEYARMVAGQFEDADPSHIWPGIQTRQLRLYVFDTAVLAETLSLTVQQLKNLHAFEIHEVRQILIDVMRELRRADILRENYDFSSLHTARSSMKKMKPALSRLKTEDKNFRDWLYLLRRIASIINHVTREAESIQETRLKHLHEKALSRLRRRKGQRGVQENDENEEEIDERFGMRMSAQKAFQAALSGGVSIAVGYTISPSHQYWVLLANLVILFGTETVGRTVIKAGERFMGTLFGAIIGFMIAHSISGHIIFDMMFLFFCVFMAFYFVSLSYAVMIFFMTMMLANMYNLLLGGLPGSLLGFRVIDTFIGAGVGTCVVLFLFPHPTRIKVRDSIIDFLNDLKIYVQDHLELVMMHPEKNANLAEQALDLEEQLQQIRNDADPLRKTPGSLARSGIEEQLTILNAIHSYAKQLTASTDREVKPNVDDTARQTLESVSSYFGENVDGLCRLLRGEKKGDIFVRDLKKERRLIERTPDRRKPEPEQQGQLIHDLFYVWRINKAIISMAENLGGQVEKESDSTGTQQTS